MDEYVPREHYMDLLRDSRDVPAVKVITGMRRCGKSTLMEMFRQEIIETGVPEKRTVIINLDDETDDAVADHRELLDRIKEKLTPGKGTYIFLDEVQNVTGWERAVESLFVRKADVYVTGSNSSLLSTEISTKLSGRCIQIDVLPLSFREFLDFRKRYGKESTTEEKLDEYIRWGGLPMVATMSGMREDLRKMAVMEVYRTVFLKDVMERSMTRNLKVMSNISRFMMKNIGHRTSPKNVSGYLSSRSIGSSRSAIENYLDVLEKALLYHRAGRKDSKTKEYLCTSDKYYITDLGIRYAVVGMTENDLDGILENLVFNELMYRYGNASVLSVGNREVDFESTDTEGRTHYYQVSIDIGDGETRKRELGPLKAIKDNYPKTVITLDRYPLRDIDGIRVVDVIEFLTSEERLRASPFFLR